MWKPGIIVQATKAEPDCDACFPNTKALGPKEMQMKQFFEQQKAPGN